MSVSSPFSPAELRSSSFSFHNSPKDQRSGSSSPSALSDPILDTPQDLICPITHEVFKDPVITASGQVYERAAIAAHLEAHHTDPLTRLPLRSDQLTPVYLLRARAAEYRESAAAACVDAACSPACQEPVRYVRRAVDLAGGGGGSAVPGLAPECCAYVAKHPSNAYDAQVMEAFARGLRGAGRRDDAATVYGALLHAGLDRAQQCELLKSLLDCWAELPGELDLRAMQCLEHFMQGHAGFRWGQIVDLLEAAYGIDPAIALCEHLLFAGGCGGSNGTTAESNGATAASEQRNAKLREATLKYVQLRLRAVADRQAGAERRLDALEAGGTAATMSYATQRAPGGLIRRRLLHLRRPGWLDCRAVSSAALTVAMAASTNLAGHPVLKLLGLLPLIYLIPPDRGEG